MSSPVRSLPAIQGSQYDSEDVDTAFAAFEREMARVSESSPAPPLPRVGTVIANKYRIVELLGRGGMGAVFSVTHQLTDRPLAIKLLLPKLARHPHAVQRFLGEARAAGRVTHPNVIQVYDIGEDNGCYYIVMELLHGATLAKRLSEHGPFAVSDACRVLIPIMRGLHAAHLAGIVHRDLKPQNIMLSQNQGDAEVPVVLDFGISKVVQSVGEEHGTFTRRGSIVGTPQYMSTEQLRAAVVDARTDVYALGVIAYHLLSGTLPFEASNHVDLACQIMQRKARPLVELAPKVPERLARIVARAMAPEPHERFASVSDLALALEPFAGGMRFEPPRSGSSHESPLQLSRSAPRAWHRKYILLCAAAAATALITDGTHMRQTAAPEPAAVRGTLKEMVKTLPDEPLHCSVDQSTGLSSRIDATAAPPPPETPVRSKPTRAPVGRAAQQPEKRVVKPAPGGANVASDEMLKIAQDDFH